jgi:site-specific DNA-methyltransferase (adenine-specific)
MTTIKIYNDDCFNILPTIPKQSVDLVLVDLPYGQTACSWDTCIDLEKMWIELKRIGKDKTAYLFFCTTKFGVNLILSNKKWWRYDLVWFKTMGTGFLNSKKMPMRSHEMIYVFYKKLPTFNPQKWQGEIYSRKQTGRSSAVIYGDNIKDVPYENKDGMRFPLSVNKFSNGNYNSLHPTMKPIDLLEWLIKSYSNEGNTVLDFTMGVGTTGKACENTGRSFIGIEKELKYFEKCLVKSNE